MFKLSITLNIFNGELCKFEAKSLDKGNVSWGQSNDKNTVTIRRFGKPEKITWSVQLL